MGDAGLAVLAIGLLYLLSRGREVEAVPLDVSMFPWLSLPPPTPPRDPSEFAIAPFDWGRFYEEKSEAEALLGEIQAFKASLPPVPERRPATGKVRTFKLPPGGRIVLARGPMATGPLPKGTILPPPEPYVGLRPEIESFISRWTATKKRLAVTFPSIDEEEEV